MKRIVYMLLFAAPLLLSGQRDEKFLADAAMGNLLEIKLGELAVKNGYSEVVRNLGQLMIKDHTDANATLLEIALKKNIAFPLALGEREQEIYDKLLLKNAEQFDKAYAKLMVKDHKKDLCKYKKEAKKGKDAEIKQYAAGTLATLQQHYDKSKEVKSQVKNKK